MLPSFAEQNAPPFDGVSYQQFGIRNGRRESSYTAFIKPVRGRRNLDVVTDCRVLRLVVSGRSVTGVEFLRDGQRQQIETMREVILSAGAIGSPHLLNLSGIGFQSRPIAGAWHQVGTCKTGPDSAPWPSLMPGCACAGSTVSASSTHRSCRGSPRAIHTRRPP